MKLFLIGAGGQIGGHLLELLRNSDEHSVRAMVRKQEQVETFNRMGVETVLANLEGTVEEIAGAINGCDGVIFSAGSGGKTGDDKTLLVDLDGAVKAMEAAERVGANRFLIVSALQAHRRENWNDQIKPYYVAKHFADKMLMASTLNYTIVRPGGLLSEPGTGKVSVAENLQRGSIPREDVAKTVYTAISAENTYRRAFDLTSGTTPIEEAIKNL